MGLLNLDLKGGFDESIKRIKSPFDRFFQKPLNMNEAINRNDFPNGLEIVEFENGVIKTNEKVILIGDSMPRDIFPLGGNQQLVKDYYPGNTEPTVQVLGPRESDIVIRGTLKAKTLARSNSAPIGTPAQIQQSQAAGQNLTEQLRQFPKEQQELIDAIRIRGNVVRLTMGDIQRFAFLENTEFNVKTLAEIDYTLTFFIIGFNPPSDCKVLGRARTVPFDINKELINAAVSFQAVAANQPVTIPRSLSEQLNEAIGLVAEAVSVVTDFVDNVLNEVDDLKGAVARAEGLIKNARAAVSNFNRRVGAFSPEGNFDKFTGSGVGGAYINASYFSSTFTSMFALNGFLVSLLAAISQIAATEPIARHRVQTGDTLQKLASRFYDDSSQWEEIFDHNKLQSTDLATIKGSIIEIPRVT